MTHPEQKKEKEIKVYLDYCDSEFTLTASQGIVQEYHLSIADDTVFGSVVVYGNKMPESNYLRLKLLSNGLTVEFYGQITTVDVSQSEYSEIKFVLYNREGGHEL